MTMTSSPEIDADHEGVRGGVQSIEIGLSILTKLSAIPHASTLSELSLACAMPASKVHRYLTSFVRQGFVTQRERSGRYELGPSCARLGLAAIARLDFVNRAGDRLEEIVDFTQAAALVAVWGDHGPTVVRWQRTANYVVPSIGLGVTLPLLTSATGHIFLAYGASRLIQERVENELAEQQLAEIPEIPRDSATLGELQRHIRRQKYATVDGRIFPGYSALSVPILNWQGEAEAAITITSRDTALLDADGPILKFMMNVANEISLQ